MAQRHQRGWLKKEKRAQGETWVLFFRTTRKSDGKRVENKIPIGLVRHLPDASSAWAEIERLHVPVNRVDMRRGLTFGDLAQHYAEHELVEASESIRPKAHTTIKGYERVLRNRLLPRWKNRIALGIEPLEVEQWLRAMKKEGDLANPTVDKTRRVMSLVYKHGQRYGLIPRNQESNPMRFVRCKTTSGYEAMILTPEQAYAIVCNLREPERTLTLLAAGTGLRISECLGLQWQDVNFADGMIHVRRTWTCGQVGLPKSKASKGPVPLHPLLADFMLLWKQKTTHSQGRRLGVSVNPPKRQTAACRQHACRRSPQDTSMRELQTRPQESTRLEVLLEDCEPFVDAVRAAAFLSLRTRRVLELARRGTIPGHPLGNGQRKVWRFRLSELASAVGGRGVESVRQSHVPKGEI
jgi:integrase